MSVRTMAEEFKDLTFKGVTKRLHIEDFQAALELIQAGQFCPVCGWPGINGLAFLHNECLLSIPIPIKDTPLDKARRVWDRLKAKKAPQIFARDGNRCKHCGSPADLTVDHIVPLAKGGDNNDSNLQTLCKRCNSAKKDR